MKRINSRHIKAKYPYLVQELSEQIMVHPNTLHNWIKNDGLPVIERSYPYLLYGQQVIDFLNARKAKRKVKLMPCEFFCCKCRQARRASKGTAHIYPKTKKTALLKAECDHCSSTVCKLISLKALKETPKIFEIDTQELKGLIKFDNSNVNCETNGEENGDYIQP